ncbi:MAG: argininosuccinate synthase [Candidatus Aureabacteria bacterium]|nr:argininosuccinate synthase [Candidatus Auribacterota bacterium]
MNVNELKGKTVALAASGGLDSCTITKWLSEYGVSVIAITADLGQPDETDMQTIRKRMLSCGAKEALVIDLKEEMAHAGIRLIQTRACYEGGYWNTTGLARHVTVSGLLRVMKKKKVSILAHGATGRGNDQVRFSLATHMLDPKVEVYAPWRDESFIEAFGGRKEMIDFCQKKHLPIKASHDKPYSTDSNLLGLTHEAGKLEWLDTPADFIQPVMGVFPKDAPDKKLTVFVEFKSGIPVAINSEKLKPVDLFRKANEIAGKNGIGIGIHTIENRFVGIKSRGVYESPGLVFLSHCYEFLLQQILDRRARKCYEAAAANLGEQIYQGYFFDLASQMMLSALTPVTRLASGLIGVSLYKGTILFYSSSKTPHSLYDPELSSMEAVGIFNHADSEGFLRVLGVNARALNLKGQVDLKGPVEKKG